MDALGELSKAGFQKYLRSKRADHASIYDALEALTHRLSPKLFNPPLYSSVITDPDNTATHRVRHNKQRAIAKWFGGELAVAGITGVIALQEKTKKSMILLPIA